MSAAARYRDEIEAVFMVPSIANGVDSELRAPRFELEMNFMYPLVANFAPPSNFEISRVSEIPDECDSTISGRDPRFEIEGRFMYPSLTKFNLSSQPLGLSPWLCQTDASYTQGART